MRWPQGRAPFPVLTLEELMKFPQADRVLLVSLARRLLEVDLSAPGAWPRGTRVKKRGSPPDDFHPDGTPGQVMGSLAVPPDVREDFHRQGYARHIARDIKFFYVIVGDGEPYPVMVPDDKLEVAR